MRLFNGWRTKQRRYLGCADMLAVAQSLGLPVVDQVELGETFDLCDGEALRRYAERTYANSATAEGVVIRPTQEMQVNGGRPSFKVINRLRAVQVWPCAFPRPWAGPRNAAAAARSQPAPARR